MKAVIIAAGMGSRLWKTTSGSPKSLLPFGDETILSTIIKNISDAGIDEIVIVVGCRSDLIINHIEENDRFGLKIDFVYNPSWEKGNGISVLAAEEEVGSGDFLLSMSDHIVSVSALKLIRNHKSSSNLLLVDPKADEVFDIDDATKVVVKDRKIIKIGKELDDYNALDCGIFRLNGRFFDAMRRQLKIDKDSISAAVTCLIEDDDMEAVEIGENDFWLDIDTPEAYRYGLEVRTEIT